MRGWGCAMGYEEGHKNSHRPKRYPYNSIYPSRSTESNQIELRPDLYALAPPTRARAWCPLLAGGLPAKDHPSIPRPVLSLTNILSASL